MSFSAYTWIQSKMLFTPGKIFSRRHIEILFLFFPENGIWHFMQAVSIGDNLHEILNPVVCWISQESGKGF